jgi:hypothetical protein
MSKPVYFIKEFWEKSDSQKFQTKIEAYFSAQKWIAIEYPRESIFKRIVFIISIFISIPKGSIVFFQYPIFSKTNYWLLKIVRFKKIKSICIVTDLDSIRDKQNIDVEFKKLNQYGYFILQNKRMEQLFISKLHSKKYATIDLFAIYYFPEKRERTKKKEIVFAGNIAKAPFVFDLKKLKNIKWNIYSQYKNEGIEPVKFHFVDDKKIDKTSLIGSFGLVWDGEFLDNISCPYGEYLKYVTPLKLSKYILAGLPIIIHEDAAMASFVNENNIGFCISTLFEIEEKINALTEQQYQQMIENLKPIAEKIASGYFLQTAINDILTHSL